MSGSRFLAVSVLLAITASVSATLPASLHEEHLEEAMSLGMLVTEGARAAASASTWAANKVSPAQPLEARPSSGIATQGDDQSSSGGSSGEHGKEEGSSKEGEKQGKCLTKEECHKKKMLCGKGCTLSAHSKCAAKCTKSCVPTC